MKRFTDSVQSLASSNPKLRVLEGFIQEDICKTSRAAGKLAAATAACDAALKLSDDPRLLNSKLWLLLGEHRYQEMLPLADRALTMSPQLVDSLRLRYHARLKTHDYVGAARDLIVARSLSPTDAWLSEATVRMVKRLRAEGDRLRKAGDNDAAALRYELALKLAPEQSDVRKRMGEGDRDGIERLRQELQSKPDDFDAHLRLDHALAVQHRYEEVVNMWDAYLGRNPEDARAYYERGGAKYRLGRLDEAKADLRQACDRHMQRACKNLKRMNSETR